MGYEMDDELWEEARMVAHSCGNCFVDALDLESEGSAIWYKFCEEHHRELYRKYEERNPGWVDSEYKGLSVPELVEKLSGDLEDNAKKRQSGQASRRLYRIGLDTPQKINLAKSDLLEILLAHEDIEEHGSLTGYVADCLGIIAQYDMPIRKRLIELLRHDYYVIRQYALRALTQTAKEEPERVVETTSRRLGKEDYTQGSEPVELAVALLTDDNPGVRSNATMFLKEIARREPAYLTRFIEELLAGLEEEENPHLGNEIKYNLILSLGFIGFEHPEVIEANVGVIQNYYDESGKIRAASSISLALLSQSLDVNGEEFMEGVRDLLDPSRYWDGIIREAVYCLGIIGDSSDIPKIEFVDTPARTHDTKRAIENSINKLKHNYE